MPQETVEAIGSFIAGIVHRHDDGGSNPPAIDDARRRRTRWRREHGLSAFRDAMHEEVLQRSEEHTSELQSLMRISYAVFCLKKKKEKQIIIHRRMTRHI